MSTSTCRLGFSPLTSTRDSLAKMNYVPFYGLSRSWTTSFRPQGACARLLTPVVSPRVSGFGLCRTQQPTRAFDPQRHIRTLTSEMSFHALETGHESGKTDIVCDVSQQSYRSAVSVQPCNVPLVPEQGKRCSPSPGLDPLTVPRRRSRQEQRRWQRPASSEVYAAGLALESGQRRSVQDQALSQPREDIHQRQRHQQHTHYHSATTHNAHRMTEKVAIIGSGNWGSAVARIVGRNVQNFPHFNKEVKMWVFEEQVDGQNLTDIINTKHENVKYLPGIKLPDNVIACSELKKTCDDATMLVFVVPHQFVAGVCEQLKGRISPNCKAISLIKGMDVHEHGHGFRLITDMIQDALGIRSCVLSGANIASEVAEERFCETTIGYRNLDDGELFKQIFHTPKFRVNIVDDVVGVELCGALKNIVAIGGGLVDGLKLGDNTKAAIIRIGLYEMRKFAQMFYKDVKDETFFESCGVADLITTCAGGRNRKVAEAHVTTGKSFDQLEQEMLNGQKLQGTSTAKDMFNILTKKGLCHEFPLMTVIYRICYEDLPPIRIVEDI